MDKLNQQRNYPQSIRPISSNSSRSCSVSSRSDKLNSISEFGIFDSIGEHDEEISKVNEYEKTRTLKKSKRYGMYFGERFESDPFILNTKNSCLVMVDDMVIYSNKRDLH